MISPSTGRDKWLVSNFFAAGPMSRILFSLRIWSLGVILWPGMDIDEVLFCKIAVSFLTLLIYPVY